MDWLEQVLVVGFLLAAGVLVLLFRRRHPSIDSGDPPKGYTDSGDPPNVYVEDKSIDEMRGKKAARARWKRAVQLALSKDGVTPDSICWCYQQDCSDGTDYEGNRMSYRYAALGAYAKGGFLRLVSATIFLPDPDFEMRSADIPFEQIKKIIMRRRTYPRMSHHTRDADGKYTPYHFYYQTRIYTASNAHYAPRGAESRIRLLEGRYVFDWLCKQTGTDSGCDTQSDPLDGYPEGV